MREVIAELNRAAEAGRPCVWCAVVETRGSTPQKAGAAMIVFADGSQAGTLGGGCIEAEVKQRALAVLAGTTAAPGRPELLTFCLDDDYGWDDGLICGGRMTILADAFLGGADGYAAEPQRLLAAGRGRVEAVLLGEGHDAPPGSRFLFDAAGRYVAARGEGREVPGAVLRHLPDLARRPAAGTQHGVAYLPVLPRITL